MRTKPRICHRGCMQEPRPITVAIERTVDSTLDRYAQAWVRHGVDLATFCGDHVRAAHDGTVLAASRRFDAEIGWVGNLKPYFARLDRKHLWGTLPITVVIDDGRTGFLVQPGDVDTLTDRLERLIADPALRERMGDAAREDAEQHSWRAATEALIGYYELTLRRHVGRPPVPRPLRARRP